VGIHLAEAEEDVFAETQHLRKRASSYSGPVSSSSDDLIQQTAARRHNSLCVPRRRGTKVAFDTDASPTSQLLHGGNRDSLLSVSAARSSPPETLGSEVPSVASGEGTYSQHPAATVQRGWGDPSRPTSATSQSTRLSQFSVVQVNPGWLICSAGNVQLHSGVGSISWLSTAAGYNWVTCG